MALEHGKLVPADAVALERSERTHEAGMKAQTINLADRHVLVFGGGLRMAGVRDLMTIDGPNCASRQFGKLCEPIALDKKPAENLIRAGGDLRDHQAPAPGVQRIEPRTARERFPAVLPGLQKIAARIAVAQDSLDAQPQELLVA
jgi:hypothetical protein